jgi:crotonobetainyl-CoA:carnitine CoA-transferase CaiB-like acyl-CoA transferase
LPEQTQFDRKDGWAASRRKNEENRHIRLVVQPVTLSRTPSKMAARPPDFGEQTEEVLAEFGFGADEIVALRQAKIV